MEAAHSRRVALEAARRLASLIDAEGRFVYRYDATSGTIIEGYHTTRHAAAIWVPAILARRMEAPDLLIPLQRATDWLIERTKIEQRQQTAILVSAIIAGVASVLAVVIGIITLGK